MDVLAFSSNRCRKLPDIRWLLSWRDIPNPVFDEKIGLHLSNINRKEMKTFIDLAAKKTQTELYE